MQDFIGKGKTIMIVEDDVALRSVMIDGLQEYFGEILEANNGLEALELLKKNSVSMVVTDYKMPKMNGLQFVTEMKKTFPLTPVVMLTANAASPEILDVMVKGLFDVVEKPYELEVLLSRIRNAIFTDTLLKIVWDLAQNEIGTPNIEEFMGLPVDQQFKIIMGYGAVLRMKASKKAS